MAQYPTTAVGLSYIRCWRTPWDGGQCRDYVVGEGGIGRTERRDYNEPSDFVSLRKKERANFQELGVQPAKSRGETGPSRAPVAASAAVHRDGSPIERHGRYGGSRQSVKPSEAHFGPDL